MHFHWIELNYHKGRGASLTLDNSIIATNSGTYQYRDTDIARAGTLFGEKVLAVYGPSPIFRVDDNPESVRYMASYEANWKSLCDQIDCKRLLEKQETLNQEQ